MNNCAYFHYGLEFPFKNDVDYTMSNDFVCDSCNFCASSRAFSLDRDAQVSAAIFDNMRSPKLPKMECIRLQMVRSGIIRTHTQL